MRRLNTRGRLAAATAVALSGTLLLAGCASGATGGGGDQTIGYVAEPSDPGAPSAGGAITFGSYSFPRSLDPLDTQPAGSTGGTEMAAVYDVLVRRDSRSGEFVPQLAETLEPSADGLRWSVTLPADATFSDGTPLDSAAVSWSLDRFANSYASGAQTWNSVVESVDTPDARTVEFRLAKAWQDFPVMLGTGAGMIVAPSSQVGEDFTPIGAGPFTVQRFAQDEELVLAAREDYSGGRAHLDTVRFVPTTGATMQLESLRGGQLDLAYVFRDPTVIGQVEEEGWAGYRDLQGQGSIAFINQREGRPGRDLRVRQAIALAIDPATISERADNGEGIVSSALFPAGSPWHNEDLEPRAVDAEAARALLAEAKADGYDGKLTYVTTSEQTAEAAALAAQAQLNAVGFDVTIDRASGVTELIRKLYVVNDFDIARGGMNLLDDAPYLRLFDGLGSESGDNASGYANAETDALLDQLLVATSDDERQSVIDQLQRQVDETVPYLVWGPAQIRVTWSDKVHGAERTVDNIVLLDKAWVTS